MQPARGAAARSRGTHAEPREQKGRSQPTAIQTFASHCVSMSASASSVVLPSAHTCAVAKVLYTLPSKKRAASWTALFKAPLRSRSTTLLEKAGNEETAEGVHCAVSEMV